MKYGRLFAKKLHQSVVIRRVSLPTTCWNYLPTCRQCLGVRTDAGYGRCTDKTGFVHNGAKPGTACALRAQPAHQSPRRVPREDESIAWRFARYATSTRRAALAIGPSLVYPSPVAFLVLRNS